MNKKIKYTTHDKFLKSIFGKHFRKILDGERKHTQVLMIENADKTYTFQGADEDVEAMQKATIEPHHNQVCYRNTRFIWHTVDIIRYMINKDKI